MINQRNIGVCILLSIVTCGIYGLYWFVKLNDELNFASKEANPTSGGMALVLTIVTCGIYGWYWMYKAGEKVDRIKGQNANTAIIYIILSFLGLGIVNYCLIQSELNKIAA